MQYSLTLITLSVLCVVPVALRAAEPEESAVKVTQELLNQIHITPKINFKPFPAYEKKHLPFAMAASLEVTRGGLVINARNHWARTGGRPDLAGKRIISRGSDGGQTWSEPVFDEALIEPTCQASLLHYSFPGEGSRSRLLFANPAATPTGTWGGPRHRLTVRLSYDDGHTWPISRLIDQGVAASSTMARLPDGWIGLIYESGGYRQLTFCRVRFEVVRREVSRIRREV